MELKLNFTGPKTNHYDTVDNFNLIEITSKHAKLYKNRKLK